MLVTNGVLIKFSFMEIKVLVPNGVLIKFSIMVLVLVQWWLVANWVLLKFLIMVLIPSGVLLKFSIMDKAMCSYVN